MQELITLRDAAQSTGTNPSTLRDWISKGVISGAVEIKSRGMAGGRKGYYPMAIIGEIQTALRMQEDGLTLETIAGAREVALRAMQDPLYEQGQPEEDMALIATRGPAARQWLSIYANVTGDETAAAALRRVEAELSAFLTLFVKNLRENMSDVIGQIVVENPNNI